MLVDDTFGMSLGPSKGVVACSRSEMLRSTDTGNR